MNHLIYYDKEKLIFPKKDKIKVDWEKAELIIKNGVVLRKIKKKRI